ncbi:HTH tetR-type domain-containing protein [Frankia sp. AiPs1]
MTYRRMEGTLEGMPEVKHRMTGRDVQRLETRQRVLDAAVAEFKRTGAAEADIRTIVESAGVARGTFYFHFPTKEHVLSELEGHEDVRISGELEQFFGEAHDLPSVLNEVVRAVVAMENRLGSLLFREVLAQHFSPTRPVDDRWDKYRTIRALVAELGRARDRGRLFDDVDPVTSAVFFLVGLYGILIINHRSTGERAEMLDKFVASTVRSLEKR